MSAPRSPPTLMDWLYHALDERRKSWSFSRLAVSSQNLVLSVRNSAARHFRLMLRFVGRHRGQVEKEDCELEQQRAAVTHGLLPATQAG